MLHFDALDARFSAPRILGGLCSIAVKLRPDGVIEHMGPMHVLRFGERAGDYSDRVIALEQLVAGAKMDAKASRDIVQALWEKWVMLASLASMTCLMRASVGDILAAPKGRDLLLQALDECVAIAGAHRHAPRPAVLEDTRTMLTGAGSMFTASMLRDLEAGGRIEADHVLGDFIARAESAGIEVPLLRLAYCHVKAYELRRQRGG
jgi:2-dehydropantoate 2-reductase